MLPRFICRNRNFRIFLLPKQHIRLSSSSMAPNEVDRTIYASATGKALETAKKHEAEKEVKLYAGWFCPFVQRTWITLEEKVIPYEYIEINPYHKDPEFLKLNPRGLVPTLGVSVPQARAAATHLGPAGAHHRLSAAGSVKQVRRVPPAPTDGHRWAIPCNCCLSSPARQESP